MNSRSSPGTGRGFVCTVLLTGTVWEPQYLDFPETVMLFVFKKFMAIGLIFSILLLGGCLGGRLFSLLVVIFMVLIPRPLVEWSLRFAPSFVNCVRLRIG